MPLAKQQSTHRFGQSDEKFNSRSWLYLCWGGEEFVVLARNCIASQAMILAEKISKSIVASDVHLERLTISIDVSETRDGDIKDHLLNRADSAHYKAESAGRNCTYNVN